ncbi:hypothetical protein GCM10022234_22460 [Aeromicrobium panaciterrae]
MGQNYLETTHQSVNWFKNARDLDQLDIAPSFQRRPVWSHKQKSDLIGTILLGYPVPELYVHEVISGDGDERHRLVDGQQRIRAVLEYLDGEFELVESDSVPQGYHYKAFEDLDSDAQKTVRSYKFVIRTLKDVDEVVIKDMFKRLNQGVVSLNEQELRHATYDGEFLKLMEQVADLPIWAEFGIFSADDIRRMRDVETVSELAVASLNGPQNKKLSLDKWYQTYEEDFPERASLETTFDTVLTQLRQVLPALKKTRWRKRSDFYTLFCALSRIEGQLPLEPEPAARVFKALLEFGVQVDDAVRQSNTTTLGQNETDPSVEDDDLDVEIDEDAPAEEAVAELPEHVVRYADAVERAATDLARRRVREQILLGVLTTAIG